VMCECGHRINEHCDGIGRCYGQSRDPEYGVFKCLCPQPIKEGTDSGSNE
jgi:hypothetical protein